MDDTPNQKISALIKSETKLEEIVAELKQVVAHHEITIQEPSTNNKPSSHEAFLNDDFGWILGFSFGIPLFLTIVIFVFFVGDIRITFDNIFYGLIGVIVGSVIGGAVYKIVKNFHTTKLRCQEEHGGYLIVVTVSSETPVDKVLAILKKWGASNISVS